MNKKELTDVLKKFGVTTEDVVIENRKGVGFICNHVVHPHYVVTTTDHATTFAKKVSAFKMQCMAI